MIWKKIQDFNYEVSDSGLVRNATTKVIRKPFSNGRGYLQCVFHLSIDYSSGSRKRKAKMKYVHRLVLETFIGNPDNIREVNHKDGDKSNNALSNLEWVSSKENKKHALDNNLFHTGIEHHISKQVLEKSTGRIFGTYNEFAEYLGKARSTVIVGIKNNSKIYSDYELVFK